MSSAPMMMEPGPNPNMDPLEETPINNANQAAAYRIPSWHLRNFIHTNLHSQRFRVKVQPQTQRYPSRVKVAPLPFDLTPNFFAFQISRPKLITRESAATDSCIAQVRDRDDDSQSSFFLFYYTQPTLAVDDVTAVLELGAFVFCPGVLCSNFRLKSECIVNTFIILQTKTSTRTKTKLSFHSREIARFDGDRSLSPSTCLVVVLA